jgi:hypothetical protein
MFTQQKFMIHGCRNLWHSAKLRSGQLLRRGTKLTLKSEQLCLLGQKAELYRQLKDSRFDSTSQKTVLSAPNCMEHVVPGRRDALLCAEDGKPWHGRAL